VFDESTEFGARVARHLRDDIVVWLTSVNARGAPQPSPVWFVWDGETTVGILSLPDTARARNIAANPAVSLNFAGDGRGGDIVVLSGLATPGEPADIEAYGAKYATHIARIGHTLDSFQEQYSLPIAIRLTGVRGH
jgi:PPOX class probable F420-dependent enzyme